MDLSTGSTRRDSLGNEVRLLRSAGILIGCVFDAGNRGARSILSQRDGLVFDESCPGLPEGHAYIARFDGSFEAPPSKEPSIAFSLRTPTVPLCPVENDSCRTDNYAKAWRHMPVTRGFVKDGRASVGIALEQCEIAKSTPGDCKPTSGSKIIITLQDTQ